MNSAAVGRTRQRLARVRRWEQTQRSPGPGQPVALDPRVVKPLGLAWRGAALVAGTLEWLVDASSTLIGSLIEALDSTVGWLAGLAAAVIELVFSIPYLGRGLGLVWRLGLTLAWAFLRLPLGLLALFGVLPEMRLRLVVLAAPGVDQAKQIEAIQLADRILRREANLRLVPVGPFQFDYPLAAPGPAPAGWHRGWLPDQALDHVGCALAALREDLGVWGGRVERLTIRAHLRGAFRRVSGWGAPLTVVTVGRVDEGRLAGCSMGPLLDYVTLAAEHPVCLLHELCHACNLLHTDLPRNVMTPTCGGVHLTRWQVALMRLSRHLTCW